MVQGISISSEGEIQEIEIKPSNERSTIVPIANALGIPLVIVKKSRSTTKGHCDISIVSQIMTTSNGLPSLEWRYGAFYGNSPEAFLYRTDGVEFSKCGFKILSEFIDVALENVDACWDASRKRLNAFITQKFPSEVNNLPDLMPHLEQQFPQGMKVLVSGLENRQELNACIGEVCGPHMKGRIGVLLNAVPVLLKPQNISCADPNDESLKSDISDEVPDENEEEISDEEDDEDHSDGSNSNQILEDKSEDEDEPEDDEIDDEILERISSIQRTTSFLPA